MLQIIFNEISAAELASLPKETQFEILEQFDILPEDLEKSTSEKYGVIERDGKKLCRYYAKNNFRIYFEKTADGITVHRVLHKSTFRDFLFRSKLPMAEDEQLGQSKAFWKLIREGEEAGKK